MDEINNSENIKAKDEETALLGDTLKWFDGLDESEKRKAGEELLERIRTQSGLRDFLIWMNLACNFKSKKEEGKLSEIREDARILLSLPGMEEHWKKVKKDYSEEFVEFVDEALRQDT